MCSPEDIVRCVVSLLKEVAYQWWMTLPSLVPRERVDWNSSKLREMSIAEHEREFVRLSKYARELVSTEVDMCTHSEWGLNEDICMLVGALELNWFISLSKRA
ncbi:Retrotransposon gag domain-containing 1 [Gossypium australe]|uniref:Retrotransposon gag domain-containing 1 n=1 Tax=Gossypium australe TaxID=47621 RepID=A0A5B6VP36_9ROSI|nr:Retrotransposon gag domain-containing 1 [Gossypium australe]